MAEWLGGGLQTRLLGFESSPWLHGDLMISEIKESINDLIKILSILRRKAPFHNLDENEKKELINILEEISKRINKIKEEIIKK